MAERHYRDLPKRAGKPGIDLLFEAKILHRRAQVALAQRDLGAAERYARASLVVDLKAGARYGEAINLRLLGVIHEKLRDGHRAEYHFKQALAIFRELEILGEVARSLNDLGNLLMSFGQFDEARQTLEEAASGLAAQGDTYGLAFVYANLGKLALGTKRDPEEALRRYRAALSLFQQFRDKLNAAKVLRNIAVAAEHQGQRESAIESTARAVAGLPADSPLKVPWELELLRLRKIGRGSKSETRT